MTHRYPRSSLESIQAVTAFPESQHLNQAVIVSSFLAVFDTLLTPVMGVTTIW